MLVTGLFAAALMFGHPVPAASTPTYDEVRAMLTAKGPQETVRALRDHGRFQYVLNRIGTGDTQWIRLAPKLSQGTDGGDSEGLTIALAEALPKSPRTVLATLDMKSGPVLGPQRVCSVPFIEPKPGMVKRYKPAAIHAVMGVRTPSLRKVSEACLEALRR